MPSNPQPAVDSAMPNKRKNRALAAEWTASDIELLIDTLHGLRRTHGTNDHRGFLVYDDHFRAEVHVPMWVR